jgi:hypothetical protein
MSQTNHVRELLTVTLSTLTDATPVPQDRKLIVVDGEAEVVRAIFRRYTELCSVRLLQKITA